MNSLSNVAFSNDPTTLLIALAGGMVPAIFWLHFWLREDKDNPEPTGLLFLTFIMGMFAVILVLPVEKFIATLSNDSNILTILWAAAEELMKFAAVFIIALKSQEVDQPVDYPIYFITCALGFAALENALFLIYPITVNDTTVSLLTGNLRFMGATLLHATSSALIGISLGLAFFQSKGVKFIYCVGGVIFSVALHSIFNFFIIENNGINFLQVFAFLWVVSIIIMLLFEKLRRMGDFA